MPADGLSDDAVIIDAAYQDRVRELFKAFAEAVFTGQPEREAVVRFQRGLVSARRVRDAALDVAKEPSA